ncbi:DUF6221 family protein [Streptomyces sp. FxanaA7]|uniref:DUF6221 family protein n=1 Tax=Streptomyces sp. FxanaA7 TaxID=1265492 RepID=UPI0005ED817C|nr:DUF6221 family protein [Streptomyces sp. FxanaA7]
MTAQGEDVLAWLSNAITARETAALKTLDVKARISLSKGATPARWVLTAGGEIRDGDDTGTLRVKFTWSDEANHITMNDPASALRRCAADRNLLELHAGRMHSCPAKDETDYLDEWTQFGHADTCPVVQLLAEGYGWTEGER